MGRNDVAIVFGRGVEIVIVGGDPCLFELAGGLIGELAERDTNLHAELFDVANDIQNRLKLGLSFLHPFPGRTHTEAACAGGFGLTRLRKDVLALHQSLGFDSCVVASALGAVATIFAASTRFDTE